MVCTYQNCFIKQIIHICETIVILFQKSLHKILFKILLLQVSLAVGQDAPTIGHIWDFDLLTRVILLQ